MFPSSHPRGCPARRRDGSGLAEAEQPKNFLAFCLEIFKRHGAGGMSFIEDAKALKQNVLIQRTVCGLISILRLGVTPLSFESGLLLFRAFALSLVERLRA
jgi:hypothetical protein